MMVFSILLLALGAPEDAVPLPPPPTRAERGAPANNPGAWVTNDDYPPLAMREEREGTTGFRLTYGTDGLPRKCDIVSSSGHADLDAVTCDLVMERARFRPGKTETGHVTGGTYSNRVRWKIPEVAPQMRGPLPFSNPGRMTLDYVVDAQGAVASCDGHVEGLVAPAGDQTAAINLCGDVRKMAPFPPQHDKEGKPVSRRYRMAIDVAIDDVEPQGGVQKYHK